MNAVGSGWSPETKITRRPPFLTGPSLKRAVTIELNALTMRAPGARAATTSLAPLPPRSARTSFGLVSAKGFVALVVEDAWQGLGLGSILLTEIMRRGEEQGFSTFHADILADRSEEHTSELQSLRQ